MTDNILSRYGMGYDPYAWRSNLDSGPPPQQANVLSQGPAPTGYDRVRDTIYNALGGQPGNAWGADKLATALDVGTLGMATGAYDGAQSLAQTGQPGHLAMALMPGMKPAGAAAKAASGAVKEATQGGFSGTMPAGYRAKGVTDSMGRTNYDIEKVGRFGGLFGNTTVGNAYVRDLGENVQVGRIAINDEHTRKGIGTALYGQIENELGKPLVPDSVLSNDAYNFWKKHRPEAVADYTHRFGSWSPPSAFSAHQATAPLAPKQEADASLIEILRKYGLMPPAALGAAASQDTAQQ